MSVKSSATDPRYGCAGYLEFHRLRKHGCILRVARGFSRKCKTRLSLGYDTRSASGAMAAQIMCRTENIIRNRATPRVFRSSPVDKKTKRGVIRQRDSLVGRLLADLDRPSTRLMDCDVRRACSDHRPTWGCSTLCQELLLGVRRCVVEGEQNAASRLHTIFLSANTRFCVCMQSSGAMITTM